MKRSLLRLLNNVSWVLAMSCRRIPSAAAQGVVADDDRDTWIVDGIGGAS